MSTKRADIVIIDGDNKSGYIIDPTVRVERDENQGNDVHLEKKVTTTLVIHTSLTNMVLTAGRCKRYCYQIYS